MQARAKLISTYDLGIVISERTDTSEVRVEIWQAIGESVYTARVLHWVTSRGVPGVKAIDGHQTHAALAYDQAYRHMDLGGTTEEEALARAIAAIETGR